MWSNITSALVAFGPWGILLLSFIDSAGIPVAAGIDVLVILVAVNNPSQAYLGASLAVLGSMAGNIVLFMVARKGGKRFLNQSETPGKTKRFRAWFQRYGLVTVFIPAVIPIPMPLKIFVVSAGAFRVPMRSFLLVVLLARILRYFGEAYLGIKVGEQSIRFLRDNIWGLTGCALILLICLFLLIKITERLRKPASDLG